MVRKLKKFPEIGELVIAQAKTIEKMYVYVVLEDFTGNDIDGNMAKGMIHISELANRWIRNISNYIRPNQRVVLKVLRVNPDKGHIDLSLRRVNSEQKINKINEWKYEVKADNLFRIFSETVNTTLDEIYDLIGFPLIEEFGDIHSAFDEIKENGQTILEFLELPEEWNEKFFTLIDSNVQLSIVEIDGTFEIVVYEGNGIEIVKNAIIKAKLIKKDKLTNFEFHYLGAPVFNFKITSDNYPKAEKYLKKVVNSITNSIKPYNGFADFYRK